MRPLRAVPGWGGDCRKAAGCTLAYVLFMFHLKTFKKANRKKDFEGFATVVVGKVTCRVGFQCCGNSAC